MSAKLSFWGGDFPVYPYRRASSRAATILDCGGRACPLGYAFPQPDRSRLAIIPRGKRRHRFGEVGQRGQSGVALRFPPQSKWFGCGSAVLRGIAGFRTRGSDDPARHADLELGATRGQFIR